MCAVVGIGALHGRRLETLQQGLRPAAESHARREFDITRMAAVQEDQRWG